MDPRSSGRTARSLETLHALCYFAPEVEQAIISAGVRKGRAVYFAGRAAPMGRVGGGTVAATFFVFSPSLVAHVVPRCWETATPDDVTAARYAGVDAAYHRLLGADALASPEMAAAADLARTAAAACDVAGRPLHAAHADLAWPDETHLVLFHALTLLREHRGDGHVAALLGEGLSGIEALVTHTATGHGFTVPAARTTRGYSEDEWETAVDDLTDRGLLNAEGGLTAGGEALRTRLEIATDEMASAPWDALGEDGANRLRDLARPLVKGALAAGAFPDGVFA